jgi:hypothetical protein
MRGEQQCTDGTPRACGYAPDVASVLARLCVKHPGSDEPVHTFEAGGGQLVRCEGIGWEEDRRGHEREERAGEERISSAMHGWNIESV